MTQLADTKSEPIALALEGVPLYRQVAESLRRKIRSGELGPRRPLPTHRALVKEFEVSAATVREALRELSAEGLVVGERGRGTFVRGVPAAEPAESGRVLHRRIGLVMPWGIGSFFEPLLGAIEDVAEDRSNRLLLINNRDDADIEMSRVRDAIKEGVDGLIWMCPGRKSNERFLTKIASELPVVAVDRTSNDDDDGVSLVEADNFGGMRSVVRHLLSLGRKRIALVQKPIGLSSEIRRRRGYEAALREADLGPSDDWVFESRSRDDQRCVERILASEIPFDAIACETDDIAVGVIRALTERGLRIPDDVAVTGFNNSVFATTTYPQFTSVACDVQAMGKRAAEILLDQIDRGTRGEGVERVRLSIPTQLVVRESTVGPERLAARESASNA